jgi:hypothetical protein
MADNEVKIRVSADAADAKRELDEVAGKEKELTDRNRPTPAPAATPRPAPAAPAQEESRRGRSMLATEANPRPAGPPRQEFRKLTDEERAANRERIAAEDAAAAAQALKKESAKEDRAAARERSAAERAVTREMREQQAMRKAGVQRVAGAISAGQEVVSGGGSASSVLSLGMRSGNPALMIGAAIAAAFVGIKGLLDKERDKDTAQGLGLRERSFNRAYALNRQTGLFGSSAGLVSDAVSADEEISQRQAARGGIAERARQKWHDPSTWTLFGMRKNAGQREQEVNEAEIEDFERRKARAVEAAQKKYMAEEGGLELRALRGRSQRTLAGSRAAMVAEMGQEWLAKYKEVMKASGDENLANEMADMATQNKVRDMQARAGAGLVDAKSGGAEMAAAARWSMSTVNMAEVVAETRALHATVQAQSNPIRDQAK